MNNEQYQNLTWHLFYIENLLENIADANAVCGGGRIVNVRYAMKNSPRIFRSTKFPERVRCARIANHWSDTAHCGF